MDTVTLGLHFYRVSSTQRRTKWHILKGVRGQEIVGSNLRQRADEDMICYNVVHISRWSTHVHKQTFWEKTYQHLPHVWDVNLSQIFQLRLTMWLGCPLSLAKANISQKKVCLFCCAALLTTRANRSFTGWQVSSVSQGSLQNIN